LTTYYVALGGNDFDDARRVDLSEHRIFKLEDKTPQCIVEMCIERIDSDHCYDFDFPLTAILYNADGVSLGTFEVDRRSVPEYTATEKK